MGGGDTAKSFLPRLASLRLASGAKLDAVPFTDVTIQDRFWYPRQEINRTVTAHHCLEMVKKAGGLTNFELARDNCREGHQGPVFIDSDLYKTLEGVSYTLHGTFNPSLEKIVDDVVELVASAQLDSGYIDTWFQVRYPDAKFTNLRDCHELYCAGHMFEAAVAHYSATGKTSFLSIALKYAELINATFGPGLGTIPGYGGHPEIELALMKLWRATGDEKWFMLARVIVERRGSHYFAFEHGTPESEYDGIYWLDDVPIRQHKEVKGHAVRAGYLMAGAADVARVTDDGAMGDMLDTVWASAVERRVFVTGGIGPSAANEGFTVDFDLPNETAYQETCASCAMAMWGHRMGLLRADARFMDAVETALYNGVLSGVSLNGRAFFYTNPLASAGDRHRSPWFPCACCPPNVLRTVATVGGYAYAIGVGSPSPDSGNCSRSSLARARQEAESAIVRRNDGSIFNRQSPAGAPCGTTACHHPNRKAVGPTRSVALTGVGVPGGTVGGGGTGGGSGIEGNPVVSDGGNRCMEEDGGQKDGRREEDHDRLEEYVFVDGDDDDGMEAHGGEDDDDDDDDTDGLVSFYVNLYIAGTVKTSAVVGRQNNKSGLRKGGESKGSDQSAGGQNKNENEGGDHNKNECGGPNYGGHVEGSKNENAGPGQNGSSDQNKGNQSNLGNDAGGQSSSSGQTNRGGQKKSQGDQVKASASQGNHQCGGQNDCDEVKGGQNKEAIALEFQVETDYPWDGRVQITALTPGRYRVMLRRPEWCRDASLAVLPASTAVVASVAVSPAAASPAHQQEQGQLHSTHHPGVPTSVRGASMGGGLGGAPLLGASVGGAGPMRAARGEDSAAGGLSTGDAAHTVQNDCEAEWYMIKPDLNMIKPDFGTKRPSSCPPTINGYWTLLRDWAAGDVISLNMDMPPVRLRANPQVKDDVGRAAVRRGPLVYCAEQADNPGLVLSRVVAPLGAPLEASFQPDLLGGVVAVNVGVEVVEPMDWDQDGARLYQPAPRRAPALLRMVPYAYWANRAPGAMLVWLPCVDPE